MSNPTTVISEWISHKPDRRPVADYLRNLTSSGSGKTRNGSVVWALCGNLHMDGDTNPIPFDTIFEELVPQIEKPVRFAILTGDDQRAYTIEVGPNGVRLLS